MLLNYLHSGAGTSVHENGVVWHEHGGAHCGSHTPVIGDWGGTGNVWVLGTVTSPKTYRSKTMSNLTFSVNEVYKHTHGLGGQGQEVAGGHGQGWLFKSNSAILYPTNSAYGLSFK